VALGFGGWDGSEKRKVCLGAVWVRGDVCVLGGWMGFCDNGGEWWEVL